MVARAPYNYDRKAASLAARCPGGGDAVTKQSFKDDCDINTIMRRFGVTGQVTAPVGLPTYDDFSGVTDFHSAMNTVRAARESFMGLPSFVRSRFGNDPGALIAFLGDPANREEAVKLGLVRPLQAVDAVSEVKPPVS